MKEAFRRFAYGLLFGAGLGLAFWVITFFATAQVVESLNARVQELNQRNSSVRKLTKGEATSKPANLDGIPTLYPVTQENNLVIESSKRVEGGLGIEIIGALKNNSSQEYQSAELEAELFDSDGNFIYECKEYVREPISPGQAINFKVSCSPLGNQLSAAYSTYALRVTHVGLLRQ